MRSLLRPAPRVVAGVAALAVLLPLGAAARPDRLPVPPYAQGIAAGIDGRPVVVPVDAVASHLDGTGVLAELDVELHRAVVADPVRAQESRDWLASGTVPGAGTRWEQMATRAMLDLDLLVLDNGAAAAGWNPNWRYVWPRDAAFVVAAYSVSGHHAEALRVLQHLRSLQEPDGTWQARYLTDGSGAVPDDRGTQLDGLGWVLWATWVWARSGAPDDVRAGLASLRPMLVAAAEAIGDSVHPGQGLPRPSPDYWEVPEREVTLGTAAPLLVGARAAAALLAELGEPGHAAGAARVAVALEQGIAAQFGRRGYPRYPSRPGRDSAVAFLMPPFAAADPGVRQAFRAARRDLTVPGGGLAPGEAWRDDGVAWTPETALFALAAAASGDSRTASRLLDWLDAHRTPLGSLPEKVNTLGQPAAVAPLAWTAATVVLTLAVLDGAALPPPPAP